MSGRHAIPLDLDNYLMRERRVKVAIAPSDAWRQPDIYEHARGNWLRANK